MKIRIKYSKLGSLRFIGHLDIMRYFQKEIKRAKLDVCYSKGYSPHQVLSFAAPLAMGITSEGEYFDAEFFNVLSTQEMITALNKVSVEDMQVTDIVLIPDKEKNAMSVVSASDYIIEVFDSEEKSLFLNKMDDFMNADEIIILKKTKKSEKEEDIKSGIISYKLIDDKIYLMLKTGSVYNLKPELVMEALYKFCGLEYGFLKFHIHRLETYMEKDGVHVPLWTAGEHICQN